MSRWRNFKLKTRSAYKKVTEPVGKFFGKLNISPNTITMISGLFAITTATMYAFNGRVLVGDFQFWWLIGFALSVVTGFIDVIDGSVARATGKTTMFGKVLDPVMDRFAEFCFLIGISIGVYDYLPFDNAMLNTIPVGVWCLFSFAGMIFASYSRARGESVAQVSVESVGIMERREKLIILFLGNLLYYRYHVAMIIAIMLVGLLSFITTIQRMVYIRKLMMKIESGENPEEETEDKTKETIT
jgi:phosphatidylglycerophosphate synthase